MKVPAVLVVLLMALLAACSGADEPGTAATQTTPTSTSIDVESSSSTATSPESTTSSTTEPGVTTTVPVEAPVEGYIRLPASPHELEMVIGPDGIPVFGFWDGTTRTVIRCSDPSCVGDLEHAHVSDDSGQTEWRLAAVHPDGNPVFLVSTPPTGSRLFVCADPLCHSGKLVEIAVQPRFPLEWTWSPVVLDGRGLIQVVVPTDAGLALVSCHDAECATASVVPLLGDQDRFVRVRDAAQGPDGSFSVLWVDERAVAPAEGEPIIKSTMWLSVIDPWDDTTPTHLDLGLAWIGAVFMDGQGVASVVGVPHPWNGPPFSYACLDSGCSDGELGVPGFLPVVDHILQDGTPSTAMPVWVFDPDFPLAWWSEENPNEGGLSITYAHANDLDSITGSDGLPFVVFRTHGQLFATHCDDNACRSGTTSRLLVGPPEEGFGALDVELAATGLPLIAVGSEGGIHLIHCRDFACTAPDGG